MFEVICLMQMSVEPRVFIIQKAAVYIMRILSIFGKFFKCFYCKACALYSLLYLFGLGFYGS